MLFKLLFAVLPRVFIFLVSLYLASELSGQEFGMFALYQGWALALSGFISYYVQYQFKLDFRNSNSEVVYFNSTIVSALIVIPIAFVVSFYLKLNFYLLLLVSVSMTFNQLTGYLSPYISDKFLYCYNKYNFISYLFYFLVAFLLLNSYTSILYFQSFFVLVPILWLIFKFNLFYLSLTNLFDVLKKINFSAKTLFISLLSFPLIMAIQSDLSTQVGGIEIVAMVFFFGQMINVINIFLSKYCQIFSPSLLICREYKYIKTFKYYLLIVLFLHSSVLAVVCLAVKFDILKSLAETTLMEVALFFSVSIFTSINHFSSEFFNVNALPNVNFISNLLWGTGLVLTWGLSYHLFHFNALYSFVLAVYVTRIPSLIFQFNSYKGMLDNAK